MPEIKNRFLGSKMDKDSDSRLIQPGFYRDALNFRVSGSESSDAGAGENSYSNKKLTNIGMGADPKTIGMFCDEFEEKIYWFVKTTTGNFVLEWDNLNEISSYVLIDTRSEPNNVLNFSEDYLITGVNVLIDSDNGNRFLLWTDGLNRPRQINIERAKTYGENGFGQHEISVYKMPPTEAPVIGLTNTSSDEENNMEEKFLSFSYRYKYLDGEYSALSPFTDYAFRPKTFFYDYSISSNESMVNRFSAANITFNTGSDLVVGVEIVFKESGSNTVYAVEFFDKNSKGWADNTEVSFLYSNSKIKRVLGENELVRIYDNVPLVAFSQELIGNRLMFANYKENINLLDSEGDKINVNLELGKVSTPVVEGTPSETMKTNRDYEIAIAYVYEGGRVTTPLTSEGNTLYIKNSECVNKNQLKVNVSSPAPEGVDSFRFYIKQSKTDYDTVIPTLFYQDGVYVWIKLEANEVNKIKEGDFIYVKADSSQILENVVQTKVLEIVNQEQNFLEDDGVSEIRQIRGTYFKIKPIGFRINEDDFEFHEFDGYDNTRNAYDTPIRNNISYVEEAVGYALEESDDLVVTPGTHTNYTGGEDVRYLIEIDSQGTPDTFRWSKDNGQTYEASGVGILGTTQSLDNGVEITFGSTTGHDASDYWIVSAKSNSDNNFGGDMSSKAYAIFKGIGEDDTEGEADVIEGGSRITITYDEYGESNQYVNKNYISSRRYDNLEEWFYGDNILSDFPIPDSRIWFRRGSVGNDGNAKYIQIDQTKEMSMIIRSLGTQNSDADGRAKISSRITIFQSENDIIFETKPVENNLDIFYEINKTYPVSNGLHIGNGDDDIDQTTSTPGEFVLDVFNAFCWGNGFESYKIKDLFNNTNMKMDTRPSSPIEEYKENYRISSITYSGVFEQTTNSNALNEFNLALANYKDLDDKYGKIKKLFSRDNNLLVFQEDKVLQVLFNKSVLYNADGSGNVTQNIDVLGQEIPYAGEYGISNNPESFAIFGNMIWFTDSKRGAVMRLSQDGLTEISSYGMNDFFRDSFIDNSRSKKLGGYDPYFDEYVLSVGDQPALGVLEVGCGSNIYKTGQVTPYTYKLKLNSLSGDVIISYNISESSDIQAVFNGTTYSSSAVSGSGQLSFTRDSLVEDEVVITVTPLGAPADISLSHTCPVGNQLKVVTIILNGSEDVGKTMTSRYKWNTSPFFAETPVFEEDGVTLFKEQTGVQGTAGFPIDGATIEMQAYQDYINSGDFSVEEANTLSYLITSDVYTEGDISTIQSLATYPTITTVNEGGVPETNKITFTMNRPVGDEILYLIYDYNSVAITENTYINIYFDSSGSMNSTLTPLQEMRDTLLQDALLPFYNNDASLYNQRVNVVSNGTERTLNMLDFTGTYPEDADNVVSLVFQDEANPVYHQVPTDINATRTVQYDSDIAAFRANLDSFSPSFYRGVIFQVDETGGATNFKQLVQAIQNGTGNYSGTNGLSDRTEIVYKYDIQDGGTAQYYLDQVTTALEELGFDLTPE